MYDEFEREFALGGEGDEMGKSLDEEETDEEYEDDEESEDETSQDDEDEDI